jgi:hypothetical protein
VIGDGGQSPGRDAGCCGRRPRQDLPLAAG